MLESGPRIVFRALLQPVLQVPFSAQVGAQVQPLQAAGLAPTWWGLAGRDLPPISASWYKMCECRELPCLT